MSRSYRKNLILSDQSRGCSKEPKRRANRKVRKAKDIQSGSNYKKESNSYNICDYVSRYDPNWKYGERRLWKWRNK